MANLEHLVERARQHVEAGHRSHADTFYRLILNDTSPPKTPVARIAHGEACTWYAREALSRGKHGTSADWYYEAMHADPLATDIRLELAAMVLVPMGLHKEACAIVERAIRLAPEDPRAWGVLGGIKHILADVRGSTAAYDRQLEMLPDDGIALLDRCVIALDTADYATVERLATKALETERRADALHALAMMNYRLGEHERAIELYDEALAADKVRDPALVRWNKSLALHSIGRYREGWAEHEFRGQQKTDGHMRRVMNRFALPIWNHEPPPARIHVHSEMGHGDVVAMARYLPLLFQKGYDVRLEVPDVMVDLMRSSLEGVRVMARSPDYPTALGIPAFDYHIPMLSLPAIFGTDLDTVPWSGPYLKADSRLVEHYGRRVPPRSIGLCWSSGIRNDGHGLWLAEYGRMKSMHFEQTLPIRMATQRTFVSLQVGPESEQNVGAAMSLLPENPSWADTAALIECLDLVITVDTAVAHLAGAMGKPVWVMTADGAASWHWMANVEGASWQHSSPWYPSAKLFRQARSFGRQASWAPVIGRVADALTGR